MKKKFFCNGRIFLLAFILPFVALSAFANSASSALLRDAVQKVVPKSSPARSAAKKKGVFKGAVLSSAAKMDKSFGKKEGDARYKFDGGVRLDFTGLSLFAGAGLPLQISSELRQEFDGGFSSVKEEAVKRWGILAQSPSAFPLRARAALGTLSFSHAISLFKSPLLSGGSSLRGVSFAKGDVGVSMPSLSSAQREEALFASLGVGNSSFRLELCAMYSNDESRALSLSLPFEFAKGCLLEAALAAGAFTHGKEYSSSWFSKSLPYKEENYAACCGVLNLKLPFAKSSSVFGANQNPSGGFYRWFRTVDGFDLPSKLGLTSFSGGFYGADSGLITASGSAPDVARQFFGCASHAFYVRESLLRGGASFRRTVYGAASASSGSSAEGEGRERDLLRVDLSLNRGRAAFSLYASGEFEAEKEGVYKAGLSWKQNFDFFRSSMSLSAKRAGEKDTLSLKFSLRPEVFPDDFSLSVGGGATCNIIEGKLDGEKIDSSLAVSFRGQSLCVNAKFSFSSEIQ
ncbi:MAG: hypothetical protein IJM03_13040 [Treponema sp.]|nr:hypothetical protein [Treponema sp.]